MNAACCDNAEDGSEDEGNQGEESKEWDEEQGENQEKSEGRRKNQAKRNPERTADRAKHLQQHFCVLQLSFKVLKNLQVRGVPALREGSCHHIAKKVNPHSN